MNPKSFYPISQILDRLPPVPSNRPLMVAIDGGSGSGKSTLAREWAAVEPRAFVVQLDDFYILSSDQNLQTRTPHEEFDQGFERRRIIDQVLEALSKGQRARYQCLDWPTGRLKDWKEAGPHGIALFDGVYSLRPKFRPFFDWRIWVGAEAGLRRNRMTARGQKTDVQMDCWLRCDDWYIHTHRPAAQAAVVVDGQTGTLSFHP